MFCDTVSDTGKLQGELKNNSPPHNWNLIIPGFIISGGYPYPSSMKKVELYNPSSGNSCPVQDLQNFKFGHSSCNSLICGGMFSQKSCEKITGTEVTPLPSLTLRQKRSDHMCWSHSGDNKVLLLGGGQSPTTTEIVSESSSHQSFDLQDDTK